jgi:hypothetical protein
LIEGRRIRIQIARTILHSPPANQTTKRAAGAPEKNFTERESSGLCDGELPPVEHVYARKPSSVEIGTPAAGLRAVQKVWMSSSRKQAPLLHHS